MIELKQGDCLELMKDIADKSIDKKKDNILCFNRVYNKSTLHPTQKPVELLEYLIKTYTNENETVLDNCMGSGSTGVACINTNRNFIGIELLKEYYDIAVNRIKEGICQTKKGKEEEI